MKPATAADHWQTHIRCLRFAKDASSPEERQRLIKEAKRFQDLHFAVIERQINAREFRRTIYP